MNIKVEYINPPIPNRNYDWIATWEDYCGAPDGPAHPVGYGKSKVECVFDLIETTFVTDFDDSRIESLAN